MNTKLLLSTASALLLGEAMLLAAPAVAQLDEIIVTARKREESLQDVPVTVTAFGEAELDRFSIDSVKEAAELVPNFIIQGGGSGSGGTLQIRGIGSSAISAAFDSAVAFNIDGVTASTMRLVQNSFLDMRQLEVLKGPQSLFFGKSASAGVVSITSNDPGDEFEAELRGGYEFEEMGYYTEGMVSGPITDQIGARLALRWSDIDEIMKNTVPGVANPSRGEQSLDSRITVTWDPNEDFAVNVKAAYSSYENDGAILFSQIQCAGATPQTSNYPNIGLAVPSGYNCVSDDDEFQLGDQNAAEAANIPDNRGGVPFEEQDTILVSVRGDWDITDALTLTTVTGYYDLDNAQNDCFGYDAIGAGCNLADNTTRSLSQEIRLASDFGGAFDFVGGLFYQKRHIAFKAWQHALGATLFAGPSLGTGFTADYRREHKTETDAYAIFGSVIARPSDDIEVNAGIRWSRELKSNRIDVPYVHSAIAGGAFLPGGNSFSGIEFKDSNYSPEVTVTYHITDDVNVYGAYKTGFKSGGIDNSALPTASLSTAAATGDFGALIFKSETAEGFEFGTKSTLLDGNMRVNASAFRYVYTNLQVQQFDPVAIQFTTSNASQLTTKGAEVDVLWALPNVEGLVLKGALAYTDTEVTAPFFNVNGTNIEGTQAAGNAKWTGNFGVVYDYLIPNSSLLLSTAGTAFYSGKYFTGDPVSAPVQDGFWRGNLAASLGSEDGLWQFSVIGQNITDKFYIQTAGGRPFSNPTTVGGPVDQVLQHNRGRQITVEGKLRF